MKKISVLIIALIMILVFATAAWGISFGARAAGMGGAFTAVADDCSAVYWNPAGITQLKVLTITPGVGIQGTQEEIQAFIDLINSTTYPPQMPDSLNLGASAYLGITTKIIGVNLFEDANILEYQESVLNKMFIEANAYGIGTIAIPLGPLAIGGNFKLVSSQYKKMVVPDSAYMDPAYLFANPADAQLIIDNSENTSAQGEGMAIDAGVLLSLTNRLRIGVTARNLYSSVSYTGSTTKYTVDGTGNIVPAAPQEFSYSGQLPTTYSVGVALRPTSSFLIAADAEMITNPVDPDFNQTLYHVGLEQLLLAKTIALRVGAFTTPGDEMGYSCGLGFKLGPVLLDGAITKVGETPGVYVTAGFKF